MLKEESIIAITSLSVTFVFGALFFYFKALTYVKKSTLDPLRNTINKLNELFYDFLSESYITHEIHKSGTGREIKEQVFDGKLFYKHVNKIAACGQIINMIEPSISFMKPVENKNEIKRRIIYTPFPTYSVTKGLNMINDIELTQFTRIERKLRLANDLDAQIKMVDEMAAYVSKYIKQLKEILTYKKYNPK